MRSVFAVLMVVLLRGASAGAEAPLPSPGTAIYSGNRDLVRELVPSVFAPLVLDDNGGLHIEITSSGDYSPHDSYRAATAAFGCQAALEADGHLTAFVAGQPFPTSEWAKAETLEECHLVAGDPDFATALAWNVAYRWQGSGVTMPVFGLAWLEHEGGKVRRIAVGQYARTYFSHRADLEESGWALEPESRTAWAEILMIREPFDLRGSMFLSYRYTERDKDDNTWAYIPALRRVRRVAPLRRADPLMESELSLEDLHLFSGRVSDFEWSFGGEQTLIAPTGAREGCYPMGAPAENAASQWKWARRERQPQPFLTRVTLPLPAPPPRDLTQGFWGCDYAPFSALPFGGGQPFERRRALVLEAFPKAPLHPTSRRTLWVDRQTMTPLYAAVYDADGALEKVLAQSYVWDAAQRLLLPKMIGAYNLKTGSAALGQFHSSDARAYTLEEARRLYSTTRLKSACR